MKIYVTTFQSGFTAAHPTEAAAKEYMRQTAGEWTAGQVEVASGRDGLCALYNHQLTEEQKANFEKYDSNGTRLRKVG